MARTERIILGFVAFAEARKAAALADGANAVTTAGEDFMRIGLMAHIPNYFVLRCIEDMVKRHRKFYHAKPSTQMTASRRDGVDRLATQVIRQLFDLIEREIA